MTQLKENIHVVIRFRPTNKREKKEAKKLKIKDKPIIYQNNDTKRIGAIEICGKKTNEPNRFTFDRILDDNISQEQSFIHVAEHVCNDVLAGYNGCIFAYGQTGSGKTYTMFGPEDSVADPSLMGIIPRSVSYIFSEIEDDPHIMEAKVKVSFVEIYKEKLRDLLNPSSKKQLKIRLNKNYETEITNVTETLVMSIIDVLKLIEVANQFRTKAQTSMNQSSSRSHMLMILTVAIKVNDASIRVGKLNLVDLAGSEKVRKTNATGDRLKEAQKINLSLTMLGQVISALSEKRGHIPFRDSKLTHVLKDSLGGNCKTTIVINASKHMFNRDETIISLRFGSRCKLITNKVKVNKIYSNNELQVMVNKLKAENTKLKLDLSSISEQQPAISPMVSMGMRTSSFSMSESSTVFDPMSNKLFDRKNKLLEQIEEYKNKINELEEDNNYLKAKNVELEENSRKIVECDNCPKLSTQIIQYQAMESEFKKNMNDMENEIEELQLETKSLRHKNKEYKIELEDITKEQQFESTKLNEELSKFKELSNEQSGVTSELMNEIRKLKQSTLNSHIIIDAQNKQLNLNQEEMNQFEKKLMHKDKIISNHEKESQNIKLKLTQSEKMIEELKSDYDKLIASKNEEINAKNDEINTNNEDHIREISSKDDEIEQLKIELENRTQKLTEDNHKLAQQIANNGYVEEIEVIAEEADAKDEIMFDDTYPFEFTYKPIGITFEHTPDKKNIRVTGIANDSAAKGKVLIESTVYKFQEEIVENIGAKYIYKVWRDKYANVLPLTITFRQSDGYYDGYKEGNSDNEQVSVLQIVKTATRISGIHKAIILPNIIDENKDDDDYDDDDDDDELPNTGLMARQTSIFDNVEYLNNVESARRIRRQTIIEEENAKLDNNKVVPSAVMVNKRNRFASFKKLSTPDNNLLTEKKSVENDIGKKEKELGSLRKMSLPKNAGKRMNILINKATIEDDIVVLKRRLEEVNKSILKKHKKRKKSKKGKDINEDVNIAIYQEAVYKNKQPMMMLNKNNKVTAMNDLNQDMDITLQFSDEREGSNVEGDEKDDDDESGNELLNELANKLRHGVEIKDRKYLFNTYYKCFIGKEAVTFMKKNGVCGSRQEGVNLGKMLLSANIIKHVTNAHDFKDEKQFYRFTIHERVIEL